MTDLIQSIEPVAVWRDHMSMAHALIQEAKGADHPDSGYVTDHLDAAENWMERAEAVIASALETARRDGMEQAAKVADWCATTPATIPYLEAERIARLIRALKEVV